MVLITERKVSLNQVCSRTDALRSNGTLVTGLLRGCFLHIVFRLKEFAHVADLMFSVYATLNTSVTNVKMCPETKDKCVFELLLGYGSAVKIRGRPHNFYIE